MRPDIQTRGVGLDATVVYVGITMSVPVQSVYVEGKHVTCARSSHLANMYLEALVSSNCACTGYLYVCACTCVYTFVCVCVCVCVHICMCACACVYAVVCVCVYVCIHSCMCVCVRSRSRLLFCMLNPFRFYVLSFTIHTCASYD